MAKYNGWTNWETWLVALWLDNDEGSQNFWNEAAEDCLGPDPDLSGVEGQLLIESATYDLSKRMKSDIEENIPEAIEGMFLDMVQGCFSEVNWDEIAKHYIESALEDIKNG